MLKGWTRQREPFGSACPCLRNERFRTLAGQRFAARLRAGSGHRNTLQTAVAVIYR